jgi:sterol desaturase/sphingolipid hydroxylase (fatty acid hydroxylase superfamily)
METLLSLAQAATTPFSELLFQPGDRIYWFYLACAAAIAIGVRHRRGQLGGWRQALAYCLARKVATHPSAIADYALWLINNLLVLLAIPSIWGSGAAVRAATTAALAGAFGVPDLGWTPGFGGQAVYTAVNILALDGGLFLAHYLHHRIPLLWEIHKVHHSAEVLTPFTVFRVHPIELCINVTTVGVLVGLSAGVFGFVYGTPPAIFAIDGVNIVMAAFLVAGYHLRHSQVWVMYPVPIARHISSPAMHLIHHSSAPEHADKNFAQIFNFWDRLTGTLYLPTQEEAIGFGLHGGEQRDFRGVAQLYLRPLRNIWRRCRGTRSVETTPAG